MMRHSTSRLASAPVLQCEKSSPDCWPPGPDLAGVERVLAAGDAAQVDAEERTDQHEHEAADAAADQGAAAAAAGHLAGVEAGALFKAHGVDSTQRGRNQLSVVTLPV